MTYSRNKVIIYGVVGVIIALAILRFIPTGTETHIVTSVNLEPITGYGFQIVKISEDNSKITSLVINIQSIAITSLWLYISFQSFKRSSADLYWYLARLYFTNPLLIINK